MRACLDHSQLDRALKAPAHGQRQPEFQCAGRAQGIPAAHAPREPEYGPVRHNQEADLSCDLRGDFDLCGPWRARARGSAFSRALLRGDDALPDHLHHIRRPSASGPQLTAGWWGWKWDRTGRRQGSRTCLASTRSPTATSQLSNGVPPCSWWRGSDTRWSAVVGTAGLGGTQAVAICTPSDVGHDAAGASCSWCTGAQAYSPCHDWGRQQVAWQVGGAAGDCGRLRAGFVPAATSAPLSLPPAAPPEALGRVPPPQPPRSRELRRRRSRAGECLLKLQRQESPCKCNKSGRILVYTSRCDGTCGLDVLKSC